jgi:hypothetical protein
MTAKKIELPEIIENDVLIWALSGGNSRDIQKAVDNFLRKYPEAQANAQDILKLTHKQPSFQHFLNLSNVDGVTIYCLLHELAADAIKFGKKIDKSRGGKERAKRWTQNNKASKALKNISNIDWPSHPNRDLIVSGERGFKQKFIDEMAEKYPEIERIKSIDELVVKLKKRALFLEKVFPAS